METGKIRIERFTDYHDGGTPINPQAVHGQVEGAVVLSAGEALMEDVMFDEKGRLLNPNLHGYLMMSIKDAPEIFSGLVDSYEPRGPFGAREIGEGSTLPVLGTVAHAIANATDPGGRGADGLADGFERDIDGRLRADAVSSDPGAC